MGIEYSPRKKRQMNQARAGRARAFPQGGPVTVRKIATGEVLRVEEPKNFGDTRAIRRYRTATPKTCRNCGEGGLVWYFTQSGKWRHAKPQAGTMIPDPNQIHFCPVKAQEKAIRRTEKNRRG